MSLKTDTIRYVSSLTKKINRERDPEKKRRMKIIKEELSKLADEL